MEIKLKKRLLPSHRLPVEGRKVLTEITGIASGKIGGVSLQTVAYENSREYLAHIAEVEIQRSIALAEARRLSLR